MLRSSRSGESVSCDTIHGNLERFSRSEMRTILFDHIEVFYNRQRHQQGLDDRTPSEVYAAAVLTI